MNLNRFTQAIRKQDWSTVLLEIVTVVIGIFLGLQVGDRNETRRLRQQESVFLDKIFMI